MEIYQKKFLANTIAKMAQSYAELLSSKNLKAKRIQAWSFHVIVILCSKHAYINVISELYDFP